MTLVERILTRYRQIHDFVTETKDDLRVIWKHCRKGAALLVVVAVLIGSCVG